MSLAVLESTLGALPLVMPTQTKPGGSGLCRCCGGRVSVSPLADEYRHYVYAHHGQETALVCVGCARQWAKPGAA